MPHPKLQNRKTRDTADGSFCQHLAYVGFLECRLVAYEEAVTELITGTDKQAAMLRLLELHKDLDRRL